MCPNYIPKFRNTTFKLFHKKLLMNKVKEEVFAQKHLNTK